MATWPGRVVPLSSGILNCGKLFPGMLLGASGLKITLEVPAASEIGRDHVNDNQTFSYKDLVAMVGMILFCKCVGVHTAKLCL